MTFDGYQIHVQQPTVPHYRIPFFDALSQFHSGPLQVSASQTVANGPASAEVERDYLDLSHPCAGLFGQTIFWQKNMVPHPAMQAGDVAVVCANPRYLSTLRFAMNARQRGMGVVWWGHGWSPTSRKWAVQVRRTLMKAVDSILLYSDVEVEEWRPRIDPDIAVIGAQNAIDQSRSAEQRSQWPMAKLQEFQQQHQVLGKKLLLFCGRLRTRPSTGVELLLRALAELVLNDGSYEAVVIGEGEDRQRLESVAHQLGVAAHVRWLGAQFDEAVIAPWFMSANCFVYPGPIGLSILHAMGYGLPVITHADRRRHNPEIVVLRDGWNGLMFEDENPGHLAQQIQRLANNGGMRSTLSNNALITAHRDYTLDTMVRRFSAAAEHAHRRAAGRNHSKSTRL